MSVCGIVVSNGIETHSHSLNAHRVLRFSKILFDDLYHTGREDALAFVVADGLESILEATGEANFLAEETHGSSSFSAGVVACGYFIEFTVVEGKLFHSLG